MGFETTPDTFTEKVFFHSMHVPPFRWPLMTWQVAEIVD